MRTMRNFNFKIPTQLDERLKAESERTGAKLSEIVRRAIDEYLEDREATLGHEKQAEATCT